MSALEDLERLEAAVTRALETGDVSGLEVVGYGEITLVVRWDVAGLAMACKRLPGLADETAFEEYRRGVRLYLEGLAEREIVVPETSVEGVRRSDGTFTAYCLQSLLPSSKLLVNLLGGADPADAEPVFSEVVERIAGSVGGGFGLDAQLSNWALFAVGLRYLDISTPMMRDPRGREAFDVELHLASVPWALRGIVRRFAIGAILDKYYDRRGALLDLAGNLHKERLEALVPAFLEVANGVLTKPLTERQVLAYYRDDARMWALLQRLRRADRWWQRTVRRRSYPFLLPGKIAR